MHECVAVASVGGFDVLKGSAVLQISGPLDIEDGGAGLDTEQLSFFLGSGSGSSSCFAREIGI